MMVHPYYLKPPRHVKLRGRQQIWIFEITVHLAISWQLCGARSTERYPRARAHQSAGPEGAIPPEPGIGLLFIASLSK